MFSNLSGSDNKVEIGMYCSNSIVIALFAEKATLATLTKLLPSTGRKLKDRANTGHLQTITYQLVDDNLVIYLIMELFDFERNRKSSSNHSMISFQAITFYSGQGKLFEKSHEM